MSLIEQALAERRLPAAVSVGERLTTAEWEIRRRELLSVLSSELFGVTPEKWRGIPVRVLPDSEKPADRKHNCAGKIETRLYSMFFDFPGGASHKMPFVVHRPVGGGKRPVILHIAFRPDYPDRYLPVEEITDRGYALVQFCYQDAAPDVMHSDFSTGLAEHLIDRPRRPDTCGNIGVWAYAASRVLDWIAAQNDLDASRAAVSGHSRLAKTALWCAAQDDRFFCVFANDGGYGGSGLIRGKKGENISDFKRLGSWCWFCDAFRSHEDTDYEKLPYDMHFLLSAVAPRYLYIGSAGQDKCMDYTSDFLSCCAASAAWEALGLPGLVTADVLPVPGETVLREGHIGYHVRRGTHYLSREDWGYFLDFLDKKI